MAKENEEKNLSTYVDYKIKEVPGNVTLKEGRSYKINNGYGMQSIVLEAIRQIGDDIVVYYKVDTSGGGFSSKWENKSCGLNAFKAQLIDFGRIPEIELMHPGKIV